ncbi:MAG: hypothetical protein LAN83_01885 [Acidobacteriia bacterium]|nr:hypothetical protein [Terriglobia bacterium]
MNADGSHGGSNAGCLSPEPFSYEEGFAVQRAIVAQIDGADDGYSGPLDYNSDGTGHAPWFDWGPYLWADGESARQDGLFWCDTSDTSNFACRGVPDLRYGDLVDDGLSQYYWGDHTHPTTLGAKKVATQIINWLGPQGHRNDWTPWLDAP